MTTRPHARLVVWAALALTGLLLGLPTPDRPRATVPAPAAPGSPATAALASVWPDARPFPIPAFLPDGSPYTPDLILDATTSIGVVTTADRQRTDLDEVPATGPPRVLQSQLATDAGSYDGLTATTDRLYWMHTLDDGNGTAHVTLWTASRSGGPARQLSADVGGPVFYGSQYDVQPVGDRLYWAAARSGHPDQTELRSIPLTGGSVTVEVLDGAWAMSRWPWLVSAPGPDRPKRLRNVTTGQTRTVRTPTSHQVSCSPTWCRLIPDQATETDLIRPDGTDLRVVGDAKAGAIASDVALLDRYEALMTTQGVVSRLTLYDIAKRRAVFVDLATTANARGDFVWWSTGDNELLAWHGLDLRTLN
jgi:hypothetical protein